MDQRTFLAESVFILNCLDSIFSVILNSFSNKNYSIINILTFRIAGKSFAIKNLDENTSRIEHISSKIKTLISNSDIWKTNINIDVEDSDLNNNEIGNTGYLFKIGISDNFNINISADKLNKSNGVNVITNSLGYIDFLEILEKKIIKHRDDLEIQKKNYQNLYFNDIEETGEDIFEIEFLYIKTKQRIPKFRVKSEEKKYTRKSKQKVKNIQA